jgi:hypothetical protein
VSYDTKYWYACHANFTTARKINGALKIVRLTPGEKFVKKQNRWGAAALMVVSIVGMSPSAHAVDVQSQDDLEIAISVAETKVGADVTETAAAVEAAPGLTVGLATTDGKVVPTLTSTTSDSTSVIGVLEDSPASGETESQLEYELSLPGGAYIEDLGDRRLGIFQTTAAEGADDGRASVAAIIDRPWALDATGKSLPTSYKVEGNTLVQTVDTAGATFPVVADPRITDTGFSGLTAVIYVQFSKAETRRINNQLRNEGIGAIAGFCATIPHPAGAAACAVIAVSKYSDLKNNAGDAVSKDECLKARVPVVSLPSPDLIFALDFYRKPC